MARMSDEDFDQVCRNHDWKGLCAEARRARAAEEHLRKACAAQFRQAVEEAERANDILSQKNEEIKAVLVERNAAIARLAELGQNFKLEE